MDRIAEIIRLENAAEKRVKPLSADRWRAAELIYAEIRDGKSLRKLGDEIGQTHTHVRYMYRCWDFFVARPGTRFDSYEALSDFAEAYRSPQVRGADDPKAPLPEPQLGPGVARMSEADRRNEQRHERSEDEPGYVGLRVPRLDEAPGRGANEYVATAASYVAEVNEHTAYWTLLSDQAKEALRTMNDQIRRILAGTRDRAA